MSGTFAADLADGCTISVRVHPGARKNSVTGIHADAVKIALTAPPVEGKANEALIEFFAEMLRLPEVPGRNHRRSSKPREKASHNGKERGRGNCRALPC